MLRFGPLEFALIAGIIIIIILFTLVSRSRNLNVKSRESNGEKVQGHSRYLKRAGFILIIIGAILLFIWMGLFRWAIWACACSFVIIAAGLVLYFVIGRKRE